MRFSRNVFRLSYACHTFLSECLAFDHACCLPPVRQTGRLAGCSVPIPPWVVIAGSAFSNRWCGYRISWVHFGLARFFMAIPTENEREHGERSRRRGVSALLREHIGFVVFSAGSPLGAARPQTCAKESSTLWTLLRGWTSGKVRFARRGWGGADSRHRHPGIRKAPPGSDKRRPHCGWPGGSGCILLTFLALRGSKWNRHSRRAARRQRRRVGLQRAKRSACRLSLPTLRDCKIKVT